MSRGTWTARCTSSMRPSGVLSVTFTPNTNSNRSREAVASLIHTAAVLHGGELCQTASTSRRRIASPSASARPTMIAADCTSPVAMPSKTFQTGPSNFTRSRRPDQNNNHSAPPGADIVRFGWNSAFRFALTNTSLSESATSATRFVNSNSASRRCSCCLS